jgi:hypothetical protein
VFPKILKPGVHPRVELPLEEDPHYCEFRVSQADTLLQLSAEYQFFTHGLLFTHGRMDRDPVTSYLLEVNPKHAPLVLDLSRAIVRGMSCKDEKGNMRHEWCRKLLMIRHEGWEEFKMYMATVGCVHMDSRYFAKLLLQRVTVPDVLKRRPRAKLHPTCVVDIMVFGVDSNEFAAYMQLSRHPHLELPRVVVAAPDPETVALATRLFNEEPEPFLGMDESSASAIKRKQLVDGSSQSSISSVATEFNRLIV